LRLLFGPRERFNQGTLYRRAQRPESLRRHLAIPVPKNGARKQFTDVAINGVRRWNAVKTQIAGDGIAVNLTFECRVDAQTLEFGGKQKDPIPRSVVKWL